MIDGANRLRNFFSATATAFGGSCVALAILLSAWWGTGHHGGRATSSLGGSFDPLALLGFGFVVLGVVAMPRKNFRLGKRRGACRSSRTATTRIAWRAGA